MITSCVGYCRFSPRPISAERDSIEAQKRLIAAWAETAGACVRIWHEDIAKSGAARDRVGLAAAIADCKRDETLVVYDWSRLGRDVWKTLSVYEQLRKRRARLFSVVEGYFDNPDDPVCKLMATIFGAFAEYNRATTAKRTSKVMRARQANGERMSRIPPYGRKLDPADSRRLVDDSHEQAIISQIINYQEQGMGQRAIARTLNESRIPLRGETVMPWNKTLVSSILRRAGKTHKK
jgi:DNA invertase Pin-like site-specific DNA recombinase